MKYEPEIYYHIYNRGAHREKIFFEDDNYRYLESLMTKHSQQSRVTIAAYCLMPNHYHIIAKQQPSGSLASFLKKTFSAYTQAMNKRFETSGTLFQGQAKIKEITTDEYCLQLIRYIHLNPVAAKIVNSPDKWKYSNYLDWINQKDIGLMDKELRDAYFPDAKDYQQFVEEYQIEQQDNKLEKFLFNEN